MKLLSIPKRTRRMYISYTWFTRSVSIPVTVVMLLLQCMRLLRPLSARHVNALLPSERIRIFSGIYYCRYPEMMTVLSYPRCHVTSHSKVRPDFALRSGLQITLYTIHMATWERSSKRLEIELADCSHADNETTLWSCQIYNILLQWRRRDDHKSWVVDFLVTKCCNLGAFGVWNQRSADRWWNF